MPDGSDLYQQLQKLRGRHGVDRADLIRHLGPEIRRRCGLTGQERDSRHVRVAVETFLRSLVDTLPSHLQRAAVLAFALERDYRYPTLDDRVERLADQLKTSHRTARRRMDEALTVMSIAAEAHVPRRSDDASARSDWRVSSLRALFRLDTETPQLYEIRRIVATRDIDEINVRIGLPDAPDGARDPAVEVLFGGHLRSMERQNGDNNYKVVLRLPRTLSRGEEHEFWLRVVLPPEQPTWAHYAIVPLDPCESGTVLVRFPANRLPSEVWLLDEMPYTDLRQRPPRRKLIEPTDRGEVARDFSALRQGYGYGLAWTPLT